IPSELSSDMRAIQHTIIVLFVLIGVVFFFSSRRRHTRSVSAFLLNRSSDLCGISTLSQSPMLGFHKQMDNRIKLLEEILSFRMQGVEFDNGDMYVDGHKAASDVRDEFVS